MDKIDEIVFAYNALVKGIETRALDDETDRAYGGIVRAGKGLLVENITKLIIEAAWQRLGGEIHRISFEKFPRKLPIRRDYVNGIKDDEIQKHLLENLDSYYYTLKTDVHCSIDGQLAIGVECKTYTENAMMKRILVDFTLMKYAWPNLNCILIQLESQLGGDYSAIDKKTTKGSPSTHTLFSYFGVDIEIITLLNGERKVDRPIHKPEYFKELKRESLESAIVKFQFVLKKLL